MTAVSLQFVAICKTHCSLSLQVCAAIWKWSVTEETNITNLGDWCKDQKGDEPNRFYWVTRPSDYMLTHFQLFSEVSSYPAIPHATLLLICMRLSDLAYMSPSFLLLLQAVWYHSVNQDSRPQQGCWMLHSVSLQCKDGVSWCSSFQIMQCNLCVSAAKR